ncbi:DNA internalization-related competence protein ComEC/Rec2 [Salicibibacter cibarius]|uniref:DNA internalization-related competence protein ComEC/Rec2 n=1 Tax=Salicibibacter cibarius TaxID=2743000 RepID=A0A7T6Z2U2_9BACI|nr:DNA internalization-related competence protein ComEC/Rec2 [Salicibibacter cibarius]QQK75802.1 DNA internalization-related competence protein ComEC/Rec2 [Salicibibacter cibarius]
MRGNYYLFAAAIGLGIAVALSSHRTMAITCALLVIIYLSIKNKSLVLMLVLVLTGAGAAAWAYVVDGQNETMLHEEVDTIHGQIDDVPEMDGDRVSFLLQLPEGKERVQVFARLVDEEALSAFADLSPGHECTIAGEMRAPRSARNFNAFDYQTFLYEQRVHWTFHHVQGEDDMICRASAGSAITSVKQWRHTGIRFIEDVFPGDIQGLAMALLFGERSHMEAETLEAYQDLGIVHLLAISGLHVGLVSGFLFFFFIRLGISRERACELLLILLPLYALLAGAAPSVLRAVLMSCAVLSCIRFRVPLHPADGISLAFIGLLLYNPYMLFHVGFQLSFAISFALIASAAIFAGAKTRLRQFMFVSILAQVVSFPLIVYHFHTYSLLSLPLNIAFVPVVSVIILPAVWVLFLLSMISPFLSSVWLLLLEKMVAVFHTVFTYVHQHSGLILVFGKASGVWVILMVVLVIIVAILFEKRRKSFVYAAVLVTVVTAFQYFYPYFDSQLRVTFIDVGQGGSILIELPYQRGVYLIDGGGAITFPKENWQEQEQRPDPGRQTVVPYLQSLGISHLDKVIVTHGDYDHYGGLFAVVEEMSVDTLLYPHAEIDNDEVEHFLVHAQEQGAQLAFVHEGMGWSVDAFAFHILHPTQEGGGEWESDNDQSIVIDAHLYGTRWLFTGDLEEEGEKRLIRDYPDLRADILKAGHHGSQTSTIPSFVEHLRPTAAVISAGENNRYNHPHPDVIQTLEEAGVQIFRTDEQGAARFYYQDRRWHGETMIDEE